MGQSRVGHDTSGHSWSRPKRRWGKGRGGGGGGKRGGGGKLFLYILLLKICAQVYKCLIQESLLKKFLAGQDFTGVMRSFQNETNGPIK